MMWIVLDDFYNFKANFWLHANSYLAFAERCASNLSQMYFKIFKDLDMSYHDEI